jgi:hypothetical protein
MKNLWTKWTNITKKIVNYLVSLILILVYFVFIIPAWIAIKISTSETQEKHKTFWIKKEKIKNNLKFALKQ